MVEKKPLVTIEIKDGSIIKIELDPDSAPNTVRNFIHLIKKKFYDKLIFHRVIPGFMIQGGCPKSNGSGGPGYRIKGEFSANGHPNPISHQRGILSMARARDYDSAGSQFFITVDDATHLDGQYAAFGKIIAGMDVVDQIVNVERNKGDDRPFYEQQIKKTTVDTFGIEYEKPEIL